MELRGQTAAVNKALAVIEFNLDGTIITANENFLMTMGYRLEEIKGKDHSMFVEPSYRASAEYRNFWRDLNDGKFQADRFKRIGKGGKEVWIQASYNPIFDLNGGPFKVVKYATDVTAAVRQEESLKVTFAGVTQNAQALGSASEELAASSQQMVSNAEDTATQAGVVSAAAEQVNHSNQRGNQQDQHLPEHHRQRRGRTNRHDQRNQPQRGRSRQRQQGDRPEHHARGPGRQEHDQRRQRYAKGLD
jgi:methyl-accepting chemotaxis protein